MRFLSCLLFHLITALVANSGEILQPFLLGCDTKNLKIVQLSLVSIQRLITHEAVSAVSRPCNQLFSCSCI